MRLGFDPHKQARSAISPFLIRKSLHCGLVAGATGALAQSDSLFLIRKSLHLRQLVLLAVPATDPAGARLTGGAV